MSARRSERGRLPRLAEDVIELVDLIPPGRVLSYGDVAELVGRSGPRQVGQVMARYGSSTCWWRVVMADGTLPPGHRAEATAHHTREGTAMRDGRIAMATARWEGPPSSALSVQADEMRG